MSLKPIDQRTSFDKRETVWALIRERKRVSLRELHMETRMHRESVRDYLVGLVNAGYLQEDGTAPSTSANGQPMKMYLLIKDAGVEAPRVRRDGSPVTQGQSRKQLWRTMRILGRFTYKELAVTASIEECVVAATEANCYCQILAKAGYLRVVAGGKGGTPATYQFLPHRYTGPRPPQIQRVKAVYDPNLKKVVWDSVEGRYDT